MSRAEHTRAMVDIGAYSLKPRDPSEQEARSKERLSKMSPEGSLGLPEKLEALRWEHGITDGYFEPQCIWDRIFVFQTFAFDKTTFVPGGLIQMSQNDQKAERYSSPRGILIGAGLMALDALRSHGQELGDTVCFIQQAPWRMEVDRIAGESEWMLIFRVGDISGNFDLAKRLRAKTSRVEYDEASAVHKIRDPEGKLWTPQEPFIREDF